MTIQDERSYVKERLRKDVGANAYHSRITFRDVVDTFKDCTLHTLDTFNNL